MPKSIYALNQSMPKSILIADDNSSIRFLIRSLIERAGFTVCAETEDGKQAIEQAQKTNPDLILLDLSMPRMNGAEAAFILKQLMPRVPIILFTLHEPTIDNLLATTSTVDMVIAKTDGLAHLLESICDLLGLKPSQSPEPDPLQLALESAATTRGGGKPTKEKAPN